MTPEERFRYAVEVVLRHEGGYVHDPTDLAGDTELAAQLSASRHRNLTGRGHRHLPPGLVGAVPHGRDRGRCDS